MAFNWHPLPGCHKVPQGAGGRCWLRTPRREGAGQGQLWESPGRLGRGCLQAVGVGWAERRRPLGLLPLGGSGKDRLWAVLGTRANPHRSQTAHKERRLVPRFPRGGSRGSEVKQLAQVLHWAGREDSEWG